MLGQEEQEKSGQFDVFKAGQEQLVLQCSRENIVCRWCFRVGFPKHTLKGGFMDTTLIRKNPLENVTGVRKQRGQVKVSVNSCPAKDNFG